MSQRLVEVLIFASVNLFLLAGGWGAGRLLFDRAMRSGEESRPARRLLIGVTVVSVVAAFSSLKLVQNPGALVVLSLAVSSILILLCIRFVATLPDS